MVETKVVFLFGGLSYMGVSKNGGTPKSSILIGFSIINHPFWGTPTETPILCSCFFEVSGYFHQAWLELSRTSPSSRRTKVGGGTFVSDLYDEGSRVAETYLPHFKIIAIFLGGM